MTRSRAPKGVTVLRLVFLLWVMMLLGGSGLASSSTPQNRKDALPNVLLIMADDFKPVASGYGSSELPSGSTPNIDRLINSGVNFMNAHAQMSLCGPSRASFLTSFRIKTLGIYTISYANALGVKVLASRKQGKGKEMLTLPKMFKRAGYNTYGMGKIFHENEYILMEDSQTWTTPMFSWVKQSSRPDPSFPVPYVGQWIESPDVDDSYYPDGQLAALAVDKIKGELSTDYNLHGTPWFLAVGFWKPHLPWHAPLKYFKRAGNLSQFSPAYNTSGIKGLTSAQFQTARGGGCDDVRAYAGGPKDLIFGRATYEQQQMANQAYHAMVLYIDAQIGKILDALHSTSSADNTLIILLGDHGFHLGDHGLYCKHSNFEQGTKAPLIIVPPLGDASHNDQRGSRSYAPVELLDLMPTLADITGIAKVFNITDYRQCEGLSLRPILQNPRDGFVKQAAVSQYGRLDRKTGRKMMGFTVRTTRYRYTQWKPGFIEVYDYLTDGLETTIVKDPNVIASLRSQAFYQKRFSLGDGKQPFDFNSRGDMARARRPLP